MSYSDELKEEIRVKNDIVEVISSYVKLQKKGSNYWGLCPFHSEKSPSFSVHAGKQMYHCFGCGESGDVYTFLMRYENYTFPEAVKVLAERAGVQLPEEERSDEARRREGRRVRLLEVNREAAKFFYYQLRSPRGAVGYQYLKTRGLSEETIHRFGLGYAGKDGGELIAYLRQKGFEDELIKEAGLANHSEKRGLVSQFWNRVMYPIQDGRNRVIGFGGRVMGDGEPKYLNSPETPVFDKRRNLYGLNFARASKSAYRILCEGYMDVISMHQAGFDQAVASLGTAFTEEQALLLHRYTDTVLLAYDSDAAGVKAALRGIGILREAGLSARVIDMRPCKDPDEFMKKMGREAFQERIDQAENSFFFEIRILQDQFDMSDPEAKTNFHREIAKKLCGFSENVERDNYLQAVADKYFIGVADLRRLVAVYAAQTGLTKPVERPRPGTRQKKDPEDSARRNQGLLLTWIADKPGIYGKIKKYISPEDFTEELCHRMAECFFAELEQGRCSPAAVIDTFENEEEHRQAARLFHMTLPSLNTDQEKEKALRDILLNVKKNSYEYHNSRLDLGAPDAMERLRQGKRALEELEKTHISLE